MGLDPFIGAGVAALPVPGAVAWWDATQITGFADGAALTQWADSSGNGHTLTPSSTDPGYHSSLVNGRAAVTMNTSLIQTAANITLPQPFSVMAVFKTTSPASGQPFESNSGAVGGFDGGGTAGAWEIFASGSVNSAATSDTALHFHCGVWNGASSTYQVDGSAATGSVGTGGFSSNRIAIGAGPWTATLCELAVWGSALNSTQIGQLRSYSQTKWGTP